MNWWLMLMTLLGGLALFLYGMEKMADALKAVAGDRMKQILATVTTSRIMGMLTGAFVTAVIQSSSVTTVILVGFVSANLMSLSQAIGVILGANIGTTITAQIVAFKITKYSLILIIAGFSMLFISKKNLIRQYGQLIMGLGLIFFGMSMMSDGMRPLRNYEPFIALMQEVSNPIIGILIATAFTALVQSSSATMGVVIALGMQGLISIEAGIALALGANIGTCITAGLASLGKPREAVRVAVAHITFNVVGVLFLIALIPWFAEFVRYISPVATSDLAEMDKLAFETPRQIANAHTLFNVGIGIIFLPLAGYLTRFSEWLVPDIPLGEEISLDHAIFLDEDLIDTPSLALHRVRMEIAHMGESVKEMLKNSMPAFFSSDLSQMKQFAKIDDKIDFLHDQIIFYLGQLSKNSLSDQQSKEIAELMRATNDLERIGDLIETDLIVLAEKCKAQNIQISQETQEVLFQLHDVVCRALYTALNAVTGKDIDAAQTVRAMKAEISQQVSAAEVHQAQRLVVHEPLRLPTYAVEIELIEKLKRIYDYASQMAKAVIPKTNPEPQQENEALPITQSRD
ncbi:MAG: Na/Pi cotransporter family protein [SAR324 cluster bacterium]|nr:Na/Pi cotransporter family protein [SAR324 cluster bacterium]MBL7036159.1 Na/Pi cotransporter family protein [SAR324 cluster bacterium]